MSRIFDSLYVASNLGVGNSLPTARVHAIGSGNTASTFTAKFQNSSAVLSLQISDDGSVYNLGAGGVSTNTTFGNLALISNTSGDKNTAFGYSAMNGNTTGTLNTAFGYRALFTNTTALGNVAIGHEALFNTTTGGDINVAVGYNTLRANTTGTENVAIGYIALNGNTTGNYNIAIGSQALRVATTSTNNIGIGRDALTAATTGSSNIAIGRSTLSASTTGAENVAIGFNAMTVLTVGTDNVAVGTYAGGTVTGSNNVFIGYSSGYYQGAVSNRLFIDGLDRGNSSNDLAKALITGVFNSTAASQTLTFNGKVGIFTNSPGARLHVIGEGNTSATIGFKLTDSSGTILINANDAGQIGINTASYDSAYVKLKVKGSGQDFFTLNATDNGKVFDVYDNGTGPTSLIRLYGQTSLTSTSTFEVRSSSLSASMGNGSITLGSGGSANGIVAYTTDGSGYLMQLGKYQSSVFTAAMTLNDSSNVGIGTASQTARLHVKGSGSTSATFTAKYQNSSSTDILAIRDDGNIGIGTTTPSAKVEISDITGLVTPLFRIQGASGELFSVYDSLTGSLMSVNDISGLPVLEVFSDNTVLMGSYLAPSLNTTAIVSAPVGTTTVYSIPYATYSGGFFEYVISDGTNKRAGCVMSIWDGSSVTYTDNSTNDIGSTTNLTFTVTLSGGNAVLSAVSASGTWTVKVIIRSI